MGYLSKNTKPLYLSFVVLGLIVLVSLLFIKQVHFVSNGFIIPVMTIGSMVAGSTPLGGGSVAFPALVHYFGFAQDDAKLFSLMIQSVGMTSASLFIILYQRTLIPWKCLGWLAFNGLIGFNLTHFFFYDLIPTFFIKLFYIPIFLAFLITLLRLVSKQNKQHPSVQNKPKPINTSSTIAGLAGGCITAFQGSGIDFLAFVILVLSFGYSIKRSTATSIILMTILSLYSSFITALSQQEVNAQVLHCWFIAAPVVLVGAPLGTVVLSKIKNQTLVYVVFLLFVTHCITVIATQSIHLIDSLILLITFVISSMIFRNLRTKRNIR